MRASDLSTALERFRKTGQDRIARLVRTFRADVSGLSSAGLEPLFREAFKYGDLVGRLAG